MEFKDSLEGQLQELIASKQREVSNCSDKIKDLQAQINMLIDSRKNLNEEISTLSRAKNIVRPY